MTDRETRGRRSLRIAGLVALFTVAGVVAGAVAFLGVLMMASPALGLGGVRDARDLFQTCVLGAAILMLPMLITALIRTRGTGGAAGAVRWVAGSALVSAALAGSIGPLVLMGMAIAGLGLDPGLILRMSLGSAMLAVCGGIGGVGGALATVRLRPASRINPVTDVFD